MQFLEDTVQTGVVQFRIRIPNNVDFVDLQLCRYFCISCCHFVSTPIHPTGFPICGSIFELSRQKIKNLGYRLGRTQTRLYSHRSWLEA